MVPAKGVERWLTQRLSHRLGVGPRGGDGVCAGVRFLSPRSLVACCSAASATTRGTPTGWSGRCSRPSTPASTSRGARRSPPTSGTAATGTTRELRRNRRYSVARRLAGLFASYAVQRPALVTDWREGRDTDGAGGLPDGPALAGRAVAAAARPGRRAAARRAARGDAAAALRAGGAGLDLPGRLSLFGHTRLPVTEVELLGALGEHRDVHLWLPQPSPALWDAPGRPRRRRPARRGRRRPSAVGHPLLASLGRDARELRRTLDRRSPTPTPRRGRRRRRRRDTLLGWLQHDLRANHAPTPRRARRAPRTTRPTAACRCTPATARPARSTCCARCWSGCSQDDPTLEPRDILVMCPDIETFAPLISAGFGLADAARRCGHPAHRLRVRLADRALHQHQPAARASPAPWSSWPAAGSPPPRCSTWPAPRAGAAAASGSPTTTSTGSAAGSREAGVRWGLDATARAAFPMERFAHNTWRMRARPDPARGRDERRRPPPPRPRAARSTTSAAATSTWPAGWPSCVDRLDRCLDAAGGRARTVARVDRRARATGVRGADRRARPTTPGRCRSSSASWPAPPASATRASGDRCGSPTCAPCSQSRLGGRPTRANFRTGTLTVCTMVPMRSVPHRVVCLVGLDDGVFPRAGAVDGDDVLGPAAADRRARRAQRGPPAAARRGAGRDRARW